MKTKIIDEMVFDTQNDRWIFISDLKSGELIYKNKPIKVFQSTNKYKTIFFQTKWRYLNSSIQIGNISWEKCKETINDRLDNSNYYKELDQLKNNTISEMYNNNHNNWTGD